MQKDFEAWNKLKTRLDAIKSPPLFNDREIWWCSVGINVGYEVYGKGDLFSRPVLIIKKQSTDTFIGLPMSTRLKQRSDYYHSEFNGKNVAFMLGEIRKFDSRRLSDKMGKISQNKFEAIKNAILKNFQPQ
ncbi:MAG: type II toxin-antitoxin system PemK/MazF family toxin [Pseudomonadota bacterium]